MSLRPRIIGMLAGDLQHKDDMQTKYGAFFAALLHHFELVDVYDASLKGPDRWVNAAQVFSFQRKVWKERFFKNVPAFKKRSLRTWQYLQQQQGRYDYVLQLGALFNASSGEKPSTNLIYTDYTAALSSRTPVGGRSPFNPHQLKEWLALERTTYQQAALIFVRSGQVKQSLSEDYQIGPEKIFVVGAGVNFPQLPPKGLPRQYDAPVILFIGQDFYRKGGDILLSAFVKIKKHMPQARLLIVSHTLPGEVTLPPGSELINPGWDRKRIEALYRQANLFVLPSRLETWGDVLLEAMAFELPCIGVTGQAMEEIIDNNRTGILVKPEDPEALSRALLELMSQPDLLTRYGQEARKQIDAQFTWERVAEQINLRVQALQTTRQNGSLLLK